MPGASWTPARWKRPPTGIALPIPTAQARDDAAMCRAEAAALAALLQAAGADVLIPDAGQLSLFGDGQ
jgi:hypothetical protein